MQMRKLTGVAVAAAFAAVPVVSALASAPSRTVTVGNNFFNPRTMTVKKGTRVIWTWHSFGIEHNVAVRSGPVKFHSRNLGSGSFSRVLSKKGTYHLYCTLHPVMQETITVR
jgi:plastocyanin